jgi:hypothetical protein
MEYWSLACSGEAPPLYSAPLVGVWLSLVEHLVRDEGVAGSNPATPTNHFNGLERSKTGFGRRCQRFANDCCSLSVADRFCSRSQVVCMVVAVDAGQHLDRHSEEPGGFPLVDAGPHQPRRCRMTQRVRRHGGVEAGKLDGVPEGGSD